MTPIRRVIAATALTVALVIPATSASAAATPWDGLSAWDRWNACQIGQRYGTFLGSLILGFAPPPGPCGSNPRSKYVYRISH